MTYEDTAVCNDKSSVCFNQLYHCAKFAVILTVLSVITGETFTSFKSWNFGSAASMNNTRAIVKKVLSVEQAEGVGARVRRSIGRQEVGRGGPVLRHYCRAIINCCAPFFRP